MGYTQITLIPAMLYAPVFGIFAALVAPFAGFFASGMKRAYKIKDFADTLPGHGGFVDRTDCIMLMMIFTYVMITQVIFKDEVSTARVLDLSRDLPYSEKIELINTLASSLKI